MDLIEAVNSRDEYKVAQAIQSGSQIEISNESGYTPIILASLYGCTEIARLLIAAGANVNAATKW